MSRLERVVVHLGAKILPRHIAFRISRAALATQGIGWAGPTGGIEASGELAFLRSQFATRAKKYVVLDIGANVGDYASACLDVNSSIQLHCFEPSQVHFERLRKRMEAYKGCSVVLNSCGLSNTAEQRTLFRDSEVSGLASLNVRDLSHIGVDAQRIQETVSLKTGDQYMASHDIQSIDMLKIDVEGWEMDVLYGFELAISRKAIHHIQFEFGHAHIERRENFRDFYRFLTSRGYAVGPLKPNGRVVFESRYDEAYENYLATNYLACPVRT